MFYSSVGLETANPSDLESFVFAGCRVSRIAGQTGEAIFWTKIALESVLVEIELSTLALSLYVR